MIMTWVWGTFTLCGVIFAFLNGRGSSITTALVDGATTGIQLCITIAGPLCLWTGIGNLMSKTGMTVPLSRALRPLLNRLFPSSKEDTILSHTLSANICANLLGLGNAATPMGIQAVKRLRDPTRPDYATDELCRLVVMNTASIQLLPTTVAAVRQTAGAGSPFDILPCVWISSVLSVCAGLLGAFLLRRVKYFA